MATKIARMAQMSKVLQNYYFTLKTLHKHIPHHVHTSYSNILFHTCKYAQQQCPFSAEAFTSSILQDVEVPIISNDECQKRFREAGLAVYSIIPDHMLCAGYKKGGKDACQVNFSID